MQVITDLTQRPWADQRAVITIGAYDGVHRGHQAVISEVKQLATENGCRSVVVTFDRHPASIVRPESAPKLLTDLDQKLELLAATGVDATVLVRFDEQQSFESATDFVQRVLVQRLSAREVWVGPKFRFGHGREGDFASLQRLGNEHGFSAQAITPVLLDGERVSSSAIRSQLAAGNLDGAARALGRPYAIAGTVVHGRQLGRKLGYPTANLRLQGKTPALGGIYASRVHGVGAWPWPSVSSLGTRPTVQRAGSAKAEPLLEAHLFDFDADLYGQRIEVEFVAKLRDEEKFDDLDALIAQMHRDAAQARAILRADFDNATMRHMDAPSTSHA